MLSSLLLAASLPQATPGPSVNFVTLLEGPQFYLTAAEPSVRFSGMSIAFGPATDFPCEVLIKEGSKTVNTVQFRHARLRGGVFTDVISRTPGAVSLGASEGPRSFEIMVEGKLAGKFDFELKKSSNGDPLDPKTTWSLIGPWGSSAYIKHKPDDGYRQDAYLVYWVAAHELKAGDPFVVATLKKGSTVIATADKRRPNGPGYSRFEQPLIKPDKNALGVKDLAGMTGSYTLEIVQGGTVIKKWNLSIGNGGIVPHALSDHTKADALEWLSPRKLEGTAVSPFTMHWLTVAK